MFHFAYSLKFLHADADNAGYHVDCSAYDVLPTDFDQESGGSNQYGGPMVNGSVHISGDRFLAAGALHSSAKDSMVIPSSVIYNPFPFF